MNVITLESAREPVGLRPLSWVETHHSTDLVTMHAFLLRKGVVTRLIPK